MEASVLAALQLVEDARYLGSDRFRRSARARGLAERTVASRRLASRQDGLPDAAPADRVPELS
jgi:hypothetical protein